jgi:hypothetical protein
LEQFEHKQGPYDLSILCSLAHEARDDKEMQWLSEMCEMSGNGTEKNMLFATLCEIQRNLVSLAHQARAVKELCQDAPYMRALLHVYHVERIPPLQTWTSTHHNTKQVGIEPANTAVAPCTSAAIQLLEYHYRMGAEPAERDRQVACSKLGCIGCELFFQYNAAKSVDMDCRSFSGSSFGGTPDKRRELMIKIVDGMRRKTSQQLQHIVNHQPEDGVESPRLHANAEEAFSKSYQPAGQPRTVSRSDSDEAESDKASDEFELSEYKNRTFHCANQRC